MQDVEKALKSYAGYKYRVQELREEIEDIISQQDSIRDKMLSPKVNSDVRVQCSTQGDPVYDAVQKIIDVHAARITLLTEELRDLHYRMDDIEHIVYTSGLSDQELLYVRLRYFEGKSIGDILETMCFSEGYMRKIKKCAIDKLERKCAEMSGIGAEMSGIYKKSEV